MERFWSVSMCLQWQCSCLDHSSGAMRMVSKGLFGRDKGLYSFVVNILLVSSEAGEFITLSGSNYLKC
ncbi:unnamed protein product [Brassica rapa subsp. trilocularis]